jgi:hypothetical protein
MHPILTTTLAEDRYRHCPCGAVTQQPHQLCRRCRPGQRKEMQDRVAAPWWRSLLNARQIPQARLFARVLSQLQCIGEGRR